MNNNNFPDIYYDGNEYNPLIFSPNAPYGIFFKQTRESLNSDADIFKRFIDNAITRFRRSRTYKSYKSYLMDLGLDRCQMMSSIIHDEMATIEMHHNGITIFDISIMIVNHFIKVKGTITTYELVLELKRAHKLNMVPLVMLSKTAHQLVHNKDNFFVPASMCFGFWTELLEEYKFGLTYGIAKKIQSFIYLSMEHQNDSQLNDDFFKLNDTILSWAHYNEVASNNNQYNTINYY